MDLGIVAAVLMLVGWAAATVMLNPAPGWVHAFLTIGVFLLIWRLARSPSSTAPRR